MQQMKADVPRFLVFGLFAVVLLVPFQTFLTVWAASAFGHLYIWSAWKEVLAIGLTALTLLLLYRDKKLYKILVKRKVNLVLLAYVLLYLIYMPFARDTSQYLLGTAINVRFVLVFFAAQAAAFYYPELCKKCLKVLAVVGVVVAALGILQSVVLPANVLHHFGYDLPGQNTAGVPPAYHLVADSMLVRAQATLRGPNPLGTYLILPFLIWWYAFLTRRRTPWAALGCVITGVAIVLSQSRAAWLGAALAAGLLALYVMRLSRKELLVGLSLLAIVGGVGVITFSRTELYRQLVLHDVVSDTTAQDSNAGHIKGTTEALRSIVRDPLGAGPGSAGPASALDGGGRIAENYFLQVMQEVGIVGGLLLLAAHLQIGILLWQRRQNSLALILGTAFAGLVLTNFLLHTWADEAVAMTWWTAAGALLGTSVILKHKKHHEKETA